MTQFRAALWVAFAVSLPSAVTAQTPRWSGAVSSSVGAGVLECDGGDCPLTNYENRNIFELQLDVDLTPRVVTRAGVSLHNINAADVDTAEDSADASRVQPVSVRVEDAWVHGYDVLVPRFDLRVGNQRMRWGTGDGYSPSDRLNPYDLADPTRFDERLPVPAVNAMYHLGDFTFSAIWIPFFVPSLLASEVVEIATSDQAGGNVDIDLGDADPPEIRELKTRVILPEQSLSEMQYAARIQWAAPIADFGLGYYWGRDSLPQLSGEVIPESFFSPEEIDVIVQLRHPRLQMIAADARAPLFAEITGWIDAALILPTRTRAFISESRLEDLARLNIIDEPDGDVEIEVQTGEPYVSFITGLDRSFGEWVYLNVQYLYGFIFERNPQDLHHYTLGTLRIPARDSRLEWELRGGGEAAPGFDAFGWLASSTLTMRHDDVFRIALMGLVQNGQEGSTLRLFAPLSEVRLTASVQF